MKSLFTFLAVFIFTTNLFSQVPQKMSYQSILRNTTNKLVVGTKVGMRVSILRGSPTGSIIYQELQSPTTNFNGLITIDVGSGATVQGRFDTINWGVGPCYIKTETDPSGGTNYTVTNTEQLLSVPYALYAKTSSDGFSGNYTDLKNKPTLFDGTWASLTGKPSFATVATTGNYNDLINKPTLFDGTWGSLTGKPSFATIALTGNYNDLINKPKPWDSSWASIKGKPANIITLASVPSKGQMIYFNGTNWDTTSKGANGQILTVQNNTPIWKTTFYIGQRFGGGIIFYIDSTGQHGYILSMADISAGTAWSNVNSTIIGVTGESLWDGSSNTTAIIAQAGHTNSAALFCKIYSGGSFTDWYLPSIDQLVKINQSKYEIDKALGSNGLNNVYWSSTEVSATNAYVFTFISGNFGNNTKNTVYRVRAVRNF